MEDEDGVATVGQIKKFIRCSGRISRKENEICSEIDIFSTFFSEICRVIKINKWKRGYAPDFMKSMYLQIKKRALPLDPCCPLQTVILWERKFYVLTKLSMYDFSNCK